LRNNAVTSNLEKFLLSSARLADKASVCQCVIPLRHAIILSCRSLAFNEFGNRSSSHFVLCVYPAWCLASHLSSHPQNASASSYGGVMMPRMGTERRKTLLTVQALRAIAAASVVVHHVLSMLVHNAGYSFSFPGTGSAGVDLFFLISGFVMVYSHCEEFGIPGAAATFLPAAG
jgi:hypothetical protein